MTAPMDVVLRLEAAEQAGAPKWRIEVESVVPRARVFVDPLCDADVRSLPHVPESVTTWGELLESLSPGGAFRPLPPTLKAVGQLVKRRILDPGPIANHFAKVEARAREEGRPLRLLFETEPADDETSSLLPTLPIELSHNGASFLFKQPERGVLRCDPRAEARSLALPRRGRLLVATAHADGREPSPTALATHRDAIVAAAEAMGWRAALLPDATPAALEKALVTGPESIDVLYVACHGLDDPAYGGRLALRGGGVTGELLGQWLEEAARQGRPVGAALLCACSSAAPERGENTSGMAQWLAQDGSTPRANTTLGFRGPVRVGWALGFLERIFQHLAAGDALEQAFVKARAAEPNEEPQWALPLLYVRRSDPGRAATLGMETGTERKLYQSALHSTPEPRVAEDLARIAWGNDVAANMDAAREVVRRIGSYSVALQIAGATIAHEALSGAEYLASLEPHGLGAGAKLNSFDLWERAQVTGVVRRALAGLPEGVRRTFFAVAGQTEIRASTKTWAIRIGAPEPQVAARLFRLARLGLLTAEPRGVYGINPILREVVAPSLE